MLLVSWPYGKVREFWGGEIELINSCSLLPILRHTCKSNIITIFPSLPRFQRPVLMSYWFLSASSQKGITSAEWFCNENHLMIFSLATRERALRAKSVPPYKKLCSCGYSQSHSSLLIYPVRHKKVQLRGWNFIHDRLMNQKRSKIRSNYILLFLNHSSLCFNVYRIHQK